MKATKVLPAFVLSGPLNRSNAILSLLHSLDRYSRPDLLQSPEMARPGISTKNTEKIPPGPKFWTPRIYPQNTPKIPKKYPQNTKNAHFWYFFGIFGVFSWGSRISARGVFFRYFSWKFRVGPSRGSVAGRGVLNAIGPPLQQGVRLGGPYLALSRILTQLWGGVCPTTSTWSPWKRL